MKFHERSSTLPVHQVRAASLAIEENDLPDGICGRVKGIAVVYDVIDSYGTVFRRGCLDKTRQRVAGSKVKLFSNHGWEDGYGPDSHVGTVRSLILIGNEEHMSADLFDTEDGRKKKEYLRAVMASGSETGLSMGFFVRNGGWAKQDGKEVYEFTEVELDEISLAPRNAVPGADVLGVRGMSMQSAKALFAQVRRSISAEEFAALVAEVPAAATSPDGVANTRSDDESSREVVSMDERLMAIRRSLTHTY